MVASLNAFLRISGATGESRQQGYDGWIELQGWDWEVTSETSWTKGGGASVGKPNPGSLNWEHYWDTSSSQLLGFICTGSSFEKVELHMCKAIGTGAPQMYWKATMGDVFITKVNQTATEEGNVSQKVEMVFKTIEIDYKQQGAPGSAGPGSLGTFRTFKWDIPAGSASPGG